MGDPYPVFIRQDSMQPKVLLNALKTSSFVRLVVATRLKHSSTDPLEDVLPQKWTELGERIQKQVIATGYEHLLARRACVKESLAKRGMETDIVDQLVRETCCVCRLTN